MPEPPELSIGKIVGWQPCCSGPLVEGGARLHYEGCPAEAVASFSVSRAVPRTASMLGGADLLWWARGVASAWWARRHDPTRPYLEHVIAEAYTQGAIDALREETTRITQEGAQSAQVHAD